MSLHRAQGGEVTPTNTTDTVPVVLSPAASAVPTAPAADKLPTWLLPVIYGIAAVLSQFLHRDVTKDVPAILAAGSPVVVAAYAIGQHYLKGKQVAAVHYSAPAPVVNVAPPAVNVAPAAVNVEASAVPSAVVLPAFGQPLPPLDYTPLPAPAVTSA